MLKLEVSYRGVLLLVLALISLWALIQLWAVIILVLTAFIFMASLLPYVEWMVRKGIPRVPAVLLLLLAFLVVLGGLLALVIPPMIDEFRDLRANLPEEARDAEEFLDDNFGIKVELEQRARDIDWAGLVSGRAAFDYGQRALLTALSALTIVVVTVYLLVDAPRLARFVYQFVPPGREPELERLLQSLSRVVGGYVRGQFITSICIGVYTLVVLLVVGVPNATAFAVLAAFADAIPMIGATIATVPPVVSSFQESPTKAVIILGALLVYQQFEDRVLTPRVYGRSLNLPPLIVLLAILCGAELLGLTGVLLALPAAAVARVGLDYILDRRKGGLAPTGGTDEVVAPDSPEKETVSG